MVRVEQVLESWKAIRNDTAIAVEDMPASELDFHPTSDLTPFREIARHVLDAGDGLTGLLLAGEDNFATPEFRAKLKDHLRELPADSDAAALAAALREAVAQRTAAFAAKPAEFFDGIVTRFDGQQVTRLEMLQSIKEHELTHRQQLFVYLRLKGIVPATTRRRLAKQAAK
ncbi:MAG TPA: DinB family protein [Candidatus Sulfopaludibacter sp.]|jgi:uncharacterized damage-inducible protein DinB|nr:DinB family protein [Candidatus Sulfopaludibacter sp.]